MEISIDLTRTRKKPLLMLFASLKSKLIIKKIKRPKSKEAPNFYLID
jgi:hypothetical protein